MAFVSASYFDIKALFDTQIDGEPKFEAKLFTYNGQRIASGDSFNEKGELVAQVLLLDEAKAQAMADAVKATGPKIEVISVEAKPSTRKPAAPFTTSANAWALASSRSSTCATSSPFSLNESPDAMRCPL